MHVCWRLNNGSLVKNPVGSVKREQWECQITVKWRFPGIFTFTKGRGMMYALENGVLRDRVLCTRMIHYLLTVWYRVALADG